MCLPCILCYISSVLSCPTRLYVLCPLCICVFVFPVLLRKSLLCQFILFCFLPVSSHLLCFPLFLIPLLLILVFKPYVSGSKIHKYLLQNNTIWNDTVSTVLLGFLFLNLSELLHIRAVRSHFNIHAGLQRVISQEKALFGLHVGHVEKTCWHSYVDPMMDRTPKYGKIWKEWVWYDPQA